MPFRKLVVLSGAGVSADSGLDTFRNSGGLWEQYRIEDVCTPEALERNPALVLDFYNRRRRQLRDVEPNPGHYAIARLDDCFDTCVVTQNVDDLHERAGSRRVLHLHGELLKCRSMKDPEYVRRIEGDLNIGDLCPRGGQMRPHIVFFGEPVPEFESAAGIVEQADMMIVVGTSLAVYPAASLVYYLRPGAPLYVVDPSPGEVKRAGVTYIRDRSAVAMPELVRQLIDKQDK